MVLVSESLKSLKSFKWMLCLDNKKRNYNKEMKENKAKSVL